MFDEETLEVIRELDELKLELDKKIKKYDTAKQTINYIKNLETILCEAANLLEGITSNKMKAAFGCPGTDERDWMKQANIIIGHVKFLKGE